VKFHAPPDIDQSHFLLTEGRWEKLMLQIVNTSAAGADLNRREGGSLFTTDGEKPVVAIFLHLFHRTRPKFSIVLYV
jgi:hypothetical protein